MAPVAAMARRGRWPYAVEKEVHHRAALERQHLVDDRVGKIFRAALGLHPGSGARSALQARSRGLPVCGRRFRSTAAGSADRSTATVRAQSCLWIQTDAAGLFTLTTRAFRRPRSSNVTMAGSVFRQGRGPILSPSRGGHPFSGEPYGKFAA